jgi:hypothetical protein
MMMAAPAIAMMAKTSAIQRLLRTGLICGRLGGELVTT